MVQSAVKKTTLDISPVGRVEGDLDVRVEIENGVVTNA
jgi:hydrogenase large subunit